MLLLLKIKPKLNTEAVMIDNVKSYTEIGKGTYCVTYRDPNHENELFDVFIRHVTKIEEVK